MNRTAIWGQTLLTAALYALAIWAAGRFVFARTPLRPLAVALAFGLVQAVAIAVMLIVLFARKGLAAQRAARAADIRGEIDDALAIEAAGQDQLRRLRSLLRRSRRDVELAIGEFVAAVRGPASERIRAVAASLGIALIDENERVEKIFARAASGNLLERAVAVEQLEPWATRVAEIQITRALTSSDPSRVTAALDMLGAWKRALPVGNLEPLLHHADAAIRARAFRAAPYAPDSGEIRRAIVDAQRDGDARVRIAAAEAAARLQLADAAPALAGSLGDADRDVAVAAAFALASLPSGHGELQRAVAAGGAAAPVALEALEKSALARLEIA